MWDFNEQDESRLLDMLFRISGMSEQPRQDDYQLVTSCLHHPRSEIRERAILIGGLRWKDQTVLGYFQGALVGGREPDDENRRLMIECLVAQSVAQEDDPEGLVAFLRRLSFDLPRASMTCKAAFAGVERLRGRMDAQAYASLDYDQLQLGNARLLS
ncbi:hypothetical protein SAMN05428989_1870 [Pseudoxanthomonas sp. GM95]|uniref:hypothetical protein n=1 Tax=Pseudoxanthomonas sp. GM95 TaxID=1881043 RepID=UPI0008AAD2A3|nr:hypothetical protein [Pseudoxanthomonas sp. GM95]SEL53790.1 hypothetical protein SAMN05428989_1870 [Pseudoxanthomonas sp. GM95]